MTLLVTVMSYQLDGFVGNAIRSAEPLTCWMRRPPPLPLSALLPTIRLASITRPGPMPSVSPGGQSWSLVLPHSLPLSVRSRLAPSMAMPPPLVGKVGLVLWLYRMKLWSIRPLKARPRCCTPPPSPVDRLPEIQLWSMR